MKSRLEQLLDELLRQIDIEQTKKVFLTIALFAHGYASIIANNSLEYDEELV